MIGALFARLEPVAPPEPATPAVEAPPVIIQSRAEIRSPDPTSGASLTGWLCARLPADWYVPPVFGPGLALATTPRRSVEYHVLRGGPRGEPTGVLLYGVRHPPHPLVVELWREASTHPASSLVVARVPERSRGETGHAPDEVREFDVVDAEAALGWVVDEARRLHTEYRPGAEYVAAVDHYARASEAVAARVEAERAAVLALAASEAAARVAVEAQRVGWTVRRGHRVAL